MNPEIDWLNWPGKPPPITALDILPGILLGILISVLIWRGWK